MHSNVMLRFMVQALQDPSLCSSTAFALTCEGDHHVVEDNSHAIVEQRLTEHHEVQVRINTNLVVKNTKLTFNIDFYSDYFVRSTV
jgi:hypothetical protein